MDGELQDLADRAASGGLKVEIGKAYEFADAARALADLLDPKKHTRGKSVVKGP